MVVLPYEEIISRKSIAFRLAKFFAVWGYRHLGNSHVESHTELLKLKESGAHLFFAGLHKSLWETTGILAAINEAKIPIPITGMGDNLIRGAFFEKMAQRCGAFIIKRARTRSELIESARALKQDIVELMRRNADIMIFPEGTRKGIPTKGKYGQFFPTMFEALIETEKEINKENVYIIPTNVDYSRVREDLEMVFDKSGTPRTLKVHDSFSMLKNLGDIHIGFGEPIRVADHMESGRKELADLTRSACLDIVKILPINLVSSSILAVKEKGELNRDAVLQEIPVHIEKMEHLKEKFRGFSAEDDAEVIFNKVSKYHICYRNLSEENLPVYKLYSAYIKHYL